MTRKEAIQVLNMVEAHGSLAIQAKGMAIKALEQEPCEDCISRADAKEIIAQTDITDGYESVFSGRQVIALLNDLPSIQPKTKVGHWIDEHCSECGCDVPAYIIDWKWQKDMNAKYCPNCGAKMESEE